MVVHSNTVGQKTLSLSSANHWLTVGQGSGDCCKVVNQHSDSWCKKGFHNSIKWWVWSARKQLHRLIPWVGQPSSLDQPSLPSRNQEISHSSTVQISPVSLSFSSSHQGHGYRGLLECPTLWAPPNPVSHKSAPSMTINPFPLQETILGKCSVD